MKKGWKIALGTAAALALLFAGGVVMTKKVFEKRFSEPYLQINKKRS